MPNLATFGTTPDEADPETVTIQGKVYELQPVGMRAMRALLAKRQEFARQAASAPDDETVDRSPMLDASIEYLLANVRPHERDRLREQIDESIDPKLLNELTSYFMATGKGATSDVPPTQPVSSPDGSSTTGLSSTATASAEA